MRKPIDLVIVAIVVIVALAFPAIDYYRRTTHRQHILTLADVFEGRVAGGASQSDGDQIVCFDKSDFAPIDAAKTGSDKAKQVFTQFGAGECYFARPKSRFNRDADGRQIYATEDGTVALWAENESFF